MSLNKRTGLYVMPSHHVYGANFTPRPTFSSMDSVAGEAELPSVDGGSVQSAKDSSTASIAREKKDRKKKKKQSITAQGVQQVDVRTPGASTPLVKVTPATGSSKGKKKDGAQPGKKRKRKSEQDDKTLSTAHTSLGSGGFVVGENMLQDVQTFVKAAGNAFTERPAPAAAAEQPAKKRKAEASRKSSDSVDFDRMAKETQSVDKKAKKKLKKEKRRSARGTPARPSVAAPASVSLPLVLSLPPKNTPVPLPANARKADRIGHSESRLVVVETPPSQLPKTPVKLPGSPIPFKLPEALKATGRRKSVKEVEVSPPTPVVEEAPSSAPRTLSEDQRIEVKPVGRVSLTSSHLMRYTQPLNDEARPKPVSRAASVAASTAGSTTSGGTTPSIQELFARVGKPYSRSGAEIDPFVVPEVKKKAHRESHDEADAEAFTQRYRAAQKAVNFSDELEYLEQASSWRTANAALGPPACLGIKASGCNTKREQVLRLRRGDASNALHPPARSDAEQGALSAAKQRSAAAECFLAHAISARVPVALGRLSGVWKLFCPAYSDRHVDKYGCGARTLSIFSVAGLGNTAQAAYTARLSIPPRSMLYSILSFAAPPHASFRPTTLRTAAEGYAMDVVFLGNGYLRLRLDLGLLLCGKPTLTRLGKGVRMEFLGVHESAVVWREERDELEVVGRKLFAKYDGEV
ncbi:uncharacterized protein EKO05_0008331 [Ascochyta rabiei]|uniref:Uncharacterized protein n=1 Tax=Didymella rabiei TaxID=5454 RepID=A0A163DKT9_DIDRA|nr:uncharacterized protein EKO05_0008331 [Ascochyta rabiei]KZM23222.1 hypothetical protein ST47_g5717 [Ascochyta rabiei]UPX18007.1 hypothetical protein EKO05_0008331 [Ascochyta rabiei]